MTPMDRLARWIVRNREEPKCLNCDKRSPARFCSDECAEQYQASYTY